MKLKEILNQALSEAEFCDCCDSVDCKCPPDCQNDAHCRMRQGQSAPKERLVKQESGSARWEEQDQAEVLVSADGEELGAVASDQPNRFQCYMAGDEQPFATMKSLKAAKAAVEAEAGVDVEEEVEETPPEDNMSDAESKKIHREMLKHLIGIHKIMQTAREAADKYNDFLNKNEIQDMSGDMVKLASEIKDDAEAIMGIV